ncbi:Crp/Fnr family transcriptional regulator [Pedobacter aquatilis]|uniref:Crp/Fnr family transcriptional regulator n=1 Tax=Pedobacter aquatilis TaxID=351343 RepID=UPI00292E7EAD|nr:Crp/Fnr family transcriptional regulator [Pedobacter aquatilis]
MQRKAFQQEKWVFGTRTFLAVLSPEERQLLLGSQPVESYAKGENIFREGSVPSGIFFIHKGMVKKYKTIHAGKQHILYIAAANELIGYHALFTGERYPDSAMAMEDCVISFIPKETFLSILNSSATLLTQFLKIMGHEFTVLTTKLAVFSQCSASERLAIALLVLKEKYDPESRHGIPISISRKDLAATTGLAKENVTRLLSELKADDVIMITGGAISIKNYDKLLFKTNYFR